MNGNSSAVRKTAIASAVRPFESNALSDASESARDSQSNRQITDRSGGSNPPSRTKFKAAWAEELKCATGVYVRRWYVETPWFTIRLHHWLRSDDDRALHDHPWWFVTFVLRGSYVDVSAERRELMSAGRIAFRSATHRHFVETEGCWTLLFTGPKTRKWGFYPKGKFKKANKYFFEHGIHVCD